MSTEKKHVLKLFVSHRDGSMTPALNNQLDVVKQVVEDINRNGTQKDLIEIKLQDYQINRNLSNPSTGTFQSLNSLMQDAENAHALFVLIDGDISDTIRNWYNPRIAMVRREKKEGQVLIRFFWNTADAVSMENCEKFLDSPDRDYVIKYNSLEDLRDHVRKELSDCSNRWAALITRKKPVPTLAAIRKKKSANRVLAALVGILVIMLAIFVYMSWPKLQARLCPSSGSDTDGEQVEAEKEALRKRIETAETMIDLGQYDSASDSLNALKGVCKKEWSSEIKRIDSLLEVVSRNPVLPPPPPVLSKPKVLLENGYEISGIEGDFKTMILHGIESNSNLRQYYDKEVQWSVQIKEERIQRGVDDGDYFVDFHVSVAIINNKTGEMAQLPLFKNECVGSPISFEDAFRMAITQPFVNQIVNEIIERIQNEN